MPWININKILSNFGSRPGIKNKFQVQAIKKILKSRFGVENLSLEQGRLFIKVQNSALAQELSFKKEDIQREINTTFNREVVKEIIIRRV